MGVVMAGPKVALWGIFLQNSTAPKWAGKGGEGGVRPVYHESLQRMDFSPPTTFTGFSTSGRRS